MRTLVVIATIGVVIALRETITATEELFIITLLMMTTGVISRNDSRNTEGFLGDLTSWLILAGAMTMFVLFVFGLAPPHYGILFEIMALLGLLIVLATVALIAPTDAATNAKTKISKKWNFGKPINPSEA